jgi:hypothetical protein
MKTKLFAALILMSLLIVSPVSAQKGNDSERWLTVEVTDTDGQPLKNACVTFVPPVGEIILLKSDKHGHAKLKRLESNSYRVVVKIDGYQAQKREVTVGSKSETVAFALEQRAN